MIKNVYWSSCKVGLPGVLNGFNETWIFSIFFFSKNIPVSNFMKVRPMGAELFHTDRRTDRHDEATSRFFQFSERA
jgi:hypothetical protein